MLSWPVIMKYKLMLDQRNTLDSQAALKALQAAKTTSPLVWQCQRVLNNISTYHFVGLFWVPGHSRIRGNEIADELARGVPVTIL
jgi:ribonuclease HI